METLKTDLDYIKFYAEELRKNPKFFIQQKQLIESQIQSNHQLSKKRFGIKNFKENARKYLKKIGLIKSPHIFF